MDVSSRDFHRFFYKSRRIFNDIKQELLQIGLKKLGKSCVCVVI